MAYVGCCGCGGGALACEQLFTITSLKSELAMYVIGVRKCAVELRDQILRYTNVRCLAFVLSNI